MDLFRRKKKEPPPPPPEVGNANLAKQVRYAPVVTIPAQESQTATHDKRITQPTQISGSPVHNASTMAANSSEARLASDLSKPLGSPIYQFETTAAPKVERSRRWYIATAIFFSVLITINVLLGLYMSAVVILFAALLLFMVVSRKPAKLTVRFFSNGLALNEDFHQWAEFEKFWILFEPPALKKLLLKRRARIISELTIELADQNPLKIRDLLLPWLPEDPTKEESRVDLVSRTLKW